MSSDKFSTWLVHQMARREMQPADFARAVNISEGVVSNWIRDKRVPSTESCRKIADALYIDLDVVLEKAGHRPLDADLPPDDPRAKIIALVEQLDPESNPAQAYYLEVLEVTLREMLKKKPFTDEGR